MTSRCICSVFSTEVWTRWDLLNERFNLYGQELGWMESKVRHYFNKEHWCPFGIAPLGISNSLAMILPNSLACMKFAFLCSFACLYLPHVLVLPVKLLSGC